MAIKESGRCIATSSDSNYFPALIALLRSLRRTNPHIPVIVFDGGLTRRETKKAGRLATIIPKKPFMDLKGRGKFSYIGMVTLLKFETAGLDFEKVLYLDADMVVLEDLEPLFSFPEGKVGVVREVNALKNMFRLQHRKILAESIGIDWNERGFNAGLLSLRPAEWRDLPERARELVGRFGPDVFSKSKDQQILNLIFYGKTHHFPVRYNFSPFYDNDTVAPAIIHYLTRCKPWHRNYPDGRCYEKFRESISITDFPGIVLVDLYRGLRRSQKNFNPDIS
ncbi:MAG: glycosyltransferase [Candidatus Omnitrophota bacterium]|nr:glycosyltransferase [Candidatus Omnitrophota bacterium]